MEGEPNGERDGEQGNAESEAPKVGHVGEVRFNTEEEGEARSYLKQILDKLDNEEPLSEADLHFLYGRTPLCYDLDRESRNIIYKIIDQRDRKEDAPVVLDCSPNEIAWGQDQINQDTKTYIGPLFPGIFDLPNLEHIYTSFPEEKIRKGEFVTCGKNGSELLADLEAQRTNPGGYVKDMLRSEEFVVHDANETILTIRLTVYDLFPDNSRSHRYDEIIKRAGELGLTNTLPHETASGLLLNRSTQTKLDERNIVVSETIADRGGRPHVFSLERDHRGLFLSHEWVDPSSKWGPNDGFVFGLRPSTRA